MILPNGVVALSGCIVHVEFRGFLHPAMPTSTCQVLVAQSIWRTVPIGHVPAGSVPEPCSFRKSNDTSRQRRCERCIKDKCFIFQHSRVSITRSCWVPLASSLCSSCFVPIRLTLSAVSHYHDHFQQALDRLRSHQSTTLQKHRSDNLGSISNPDLDSARRREDKKADSGDRMGGSGSSKDGFPSLVSSLMSGIVL
jgi:hypothetical protein